MQRRIALACSVRFTVIDLDGLNNSKFDRMRKITTRQTCLLNRISDRLHKSFPPFENDILSSELHGMNKVTQGSFVGYY